VPTYDYACKMCGKIEEHVHRMSESPEILCSLCGCSMERKFSPSIAGFILKGGTPASHYKEKRLRMKKREQIGQSHMHGPRIQPNVAGMEVDSWKDAQKLAKEAGMNHQSYQPMVDREKPKIVVVAQ
jgi:putative FmdB family regulatory protein